MQSRQQKFLLAASRSSCCAAKSSDRDGVKTAAQFAQTLRLRMKALLMLLGIDVELVDCWGALISVWNKFSIVKLFRITATARATNQTNLRRGEQIKNPKGSLSEVPLRK